MKLSVNDVVAQAERVGLRPSEWADLADGGGEATVSWQPIAPPSAAEWREAVMSTVDGEP
jgi:hypothetical protein